MGQKEFRDFQALYQSTLNPEGVLREAIPHISVALQRPKDGIHEKVQKRSVQLHFDEAVRILMQIFKSPKELRACIPSIVEDDVQIKKTQLYHFASIWDEHLSVSRLQSNNTNQHQSLQKMLTHGHSRIRRVVSDEEYAALKKRKMQRKSDRRIDS